MNAIDRAIETAPSQREFAEKVGVTPALMSMWKNRGEVPAIYAIKVEQACRAVVTRYDLRPDVFGTAND